MHIEKGVPREIGACNFCNRGEVSQDGRGIIYPYNRVTKLHGKHISVNLCGECKQKAAALLGGAEKTYLAYQERIAALETQLEVFQAKAADPSVMDARLAEAIIKDIERPVCEWEAWERREYWELYGKCPMCQCRKCKQNIAGGDVMGICEGCRSRQASFGSMALARINEERLGKSHADLCFDCAMNNEAGRRLPTARPEPPLDKVIKEISTETCFGSELAKHFYLKTGDKDFCVELSILHGMGYSSIALNLLADAFAENRARGKSDIRLFPGRA